MTDAAMKSLTAGSAVVAEFLCEFGHRTRSQIQHRANGRGCPLCANQRLGRRALYVILNPAHDLLKVGVTRAGSDRRLEEFAVAGWQRVLVVDVLDATDAFKIEADIKHRLQAESHPPDLAARRAAAAAGLNGRTEMFAVDTWRTVVGSAIPEAIDGWVLGLIRTVLEPTRWERRAA